MKIEDITVTRSRRKTISLSVTDDFKICVKAPIQCGDDEILRFVLSKRRWIEGRMAKIREIDVLPPLSPQEIDELKSRAMRYIPDRVEFYAAQMGADYGKITVRSQTSRWGSCSAKGNLSFNCCLMLTPPEIIDYVVVHELCHRREMNHSKRFYLELSRVLPDYREREKWLRENGEGIIRRIKKK